jgi:hypothetical protein
LRNVNPIKENLEPDNIWCYITDNYNLYFRRLRDIVNVRSGGLNYMKALIGGSLVSVLGIVLLVIWWEEFLMILSGILPVSLLIGGGISIYLGFDELKENWNKENIISGTLSSEVEKYKQEIDELKKEIESLKKG